MSLPSSSRTPLLRILGYALGEGAVSITINGVSNFALLFYTQVLGLGATYAGFALSVTLLMDAIVDPLMGHITDNTRSRWGRRMPYIVVGGLLLSVFYFLLWIPLPGAASPVWLFIWALIGNLLLRLSVTVFGIPYTALGFEICPSYEDRSRLQGIRSAFSMAVNLVFGAFAWSLFFRDGRGADGSRIDGTTIASNYAVMGGVLAAAAIVLVTLCVFFTRSTAKDNRLAPLHDHSLSSFRKDMSQIFRDRLAWIVFGFFGAALFGMLLVSQAQMFVYVFFMKLPADAKTIIHGSGMVACGAAALFQAWLTRKTDKKITGYIGMLLAIFGGIFLTVVFFGLGVAPDAAWTVAGYTLPLGAILFGFGQVCWWGGVGILGPLAMSMVADLSEINYLRTGVLKDGGYSAVFTFFQKASMSIGLLLTGWMVSAAGIVSGVESQTPEAARSIALMTFLSGPVCVLIGFFVLRLYPVDRSYLQRIKEEQRPPADHS